MMPGAYNNNVQLFLTPTHFVIFNEMVHDARIVPLDTRPALDPAIRQWSGSSRGRWQGETLVVETVNFNGKNSFRGASDRVHLTERFTRVDADTLMYEFTVDDPSTFTKPWTGQIPMRMTNATLFEYACHEGNYGMTGILAGARSQDARSAQEKRP
jgi:hypothetical protein